ncbi:hypothetical protein TNCV_2802511 [Trichonephila clavipes]|nr:hypothetical protein TNCV_2802511 [Trichonephila clavipes]
MLHYEVTRGLLVTDLEILNNGQVTATKLPSFTFSKLLNHTKVRALKLDRLNVHQPFYTAGIQQFQDSISRLDISKSGHREAQSSDHD